jgi:hypothetical protein
MALVAHHNSALASSHASLHQDKMRSHRYYAGQGHNHHEQHSPPFLYTGPRLQSACGSRKAKKVLGLVAQFERRSTDEDERGGASKAQRTLGLVPELPRDRRSWRKPGSGELKGAFEQELARAEKNIRRISRMQGLAVDMHFDAGAAAYDEQADAEEVHQGHQISQPLEAEHDNEEEASQPDPEKPPILELPLSQSPQQLSFPYVIELDAGPDQELLLPPRHLRTRPHSYTSPRFSSRPKNKIASSRSRGLSSPPNFSRPLSAGFSPKVVVPGEDLERDPLSIRFTDVEDDPRSPMSPIGGTFVSNEIKAALANLERGMVASRAASPMPSSPPPPQLKRASKTRWSSLPVSLMKLAHKRKASKEEREGDGLGLRIRLDRKEAKQVLTLTEENLQRWEDAVGYVPKMYRAGHEGLHTPVEHDMGGAYYTPRQDKLALARAQGQVLTPPLTLSPPISPRLVQRPLASPLSPSLTPTLSHASFAPTHSVNIRSSTTSTLLRRFPEPPAATSVPPLPPPYMRSQSLASQKETMAHVQTPAHVMACAGCGESEHPSTFEGRLCRECLRWRDARERV